MKNSIALVAAATVALASATQAASLYTNSFNTDDSANWTINSTLATAATGGAPTSDAVFAYDYSASNIDIPLAPHTTDGSRLGLRVRVDTTSGTANASVGAISLSPNGQSFTGTPYTLSVDVWSNYVGGTSSIASGGANSTAGPLVGVGTATGVTTPNANDGVFVGVVKDGGTSAASNSDYRIYTKNTRRTEGTYFRASGTNFADNGNAYYTSKFPSVSAPAGQSAASVTQSGSTPAGITAFAWHTYTLTNDGTTIVWYIDDKQIGAVPIALIGSLGGSNLSLGAFDTGTTGSAAANPALFNFEIFDNLSVVDGITLPEPTSLFAAGFAVAGLVARRRKA